MSRLDLVIFGATGFTGKYTAEEQVRISQRDKTLTWGIAGRSKSKLEQLLNNLTVKTGENLSNVKIIVADVSDEESLKSMTAQAKVIVNCCGPFRHYGEPVIKACIATKTHHVDVSGEPEFMETMALEYGKKAEEAGVYIVSACGFDSIPNDMGVVYLQQNFKGVLNSVESHVSMDLPEKYRKWFSPALHYGTWESLVYGLSNWEELGKLRKRMFPEKIPSFKPTLKSRSIIHKHGSLWYLPFPGADKSIVYRTQRHFYETEKKRPVQFKPYIGFPSLLAAFMTIIGGIVLYLMSKTSFTRSLLLRFPAVFSLGLASHEGPSEEVMQNTTFTFNLRGEGWNEGADVATPPNKKMLAKVTGVNPGYGATVVALLHSGLTIIKENDKMPGKGGVLTTGVAFSKTNLIKTLQENNFCFTIVQEK